MVQVYAVDAGKLPDPKEYPEVLTGLAKERQEKTMRYLQPGDRKRSLGAGMLLREVLPRYGVSPEDICLGVNGKPQVEGLWFNLSHSGCWAVCAVGSKPVGCDVEQIARAPERVAERFFHRNEAAYLRRCRDGERDAVFYRFWTMKESYMKMTGEGMRLSFDSIEFSIETEPVQVIRDGQALSCHIREYVLPGYRISVCAEEGRFGESIEILDFAGIG